MKCTSSEAAKLLKQLNEDLQNLTAEENKCHVFNASVNENLDDVRPAYNYEYMQEKMQEIEKKIRTVKHAINVFNSRTIIPDFDMTIDQMLVYLPQLTARVRKFRGMSSRLPKERESTRSLLGNSNVIDYRYTNYDIDKAKQDYLEAMTTLSKAQTALDLINTTKKFEIDL